MGVCLRRALALLLIVGLLGPGLAGCGKKRDPIPPPDSIPTYPKSYPSE